MIAKATADRLGQKTAQRALVLELKRGYDLSPIEAEVLVQRIEQYVDEHYSSDRSEGQIVYHAVAVEEAPGKPVAACRNRLLNPNATGMYPGSRPGFWLCSVNAGTNRIKRTD